MSRAPRAAVTRPGSPAPEAKLRIPELHPGLVERERFFQVARLSEAARVVVLTAPAGYGKTTTLAKWAAADPRPTAFLSVTQSDNDAATLIGWLARALDGIEHLGTTDLAQLTTSGADPIRDLIPRLSRVLAERGRPFILMFDNVDRLHTRTSAAVLEMLMAESAASSYQLVMAGRSEPRLDLTRLQANGQVERFGVDDLRMSVEESVALLRAAGLPLDGDTAGLLVHKTEGWPGGLYLAALALRGQDDPVHAAQVFTGDDRLVADYVRSEFLSLVSPEVGAFLVRSAVLDALSGELCDAVLERTDSAAVLAEMASSNLLVIPLDRRREWYRYHRLLRDVLLTQLHRELPELEPGLHARAGKWYERRGYLDPAIEHAKKAGDVQRAVRLVWGSAPARLSEGLEGTVGRWLELFNADEIARSPALAVTAAWWALTVGDIDGVDRWALAVELMPPDEPLPNGTPVRAVAALLSALSGTHGLTRMRDDAAKAFELAEPQSPHRALARLLEGAALRLLDDEPAARERLNEAARLGKWIAPTVAAQALSQLALLALQGGDGDEALRLVEHALRILEQYLVAERPAMGVVFAVAALVHARCNQTDSALDESKTGLRLIAGLEFLGPWAAIESRILIARATLLCGEAATARDLVAASALLLRRYPDSGSLPEQLGSVVGQVDAASLTLGRGTPSLTPAEARVLRQLPTHLSFGDIADALFVSRNTVKTQAIAVYRKLGVTSRAKAVEKAREIGLIDR